VHVLAGPGTGKTFMMMRRIARMIETGVPPEDILALTFTRTAAGDLREHLGTLGVDGSENVRATTLHALCFRVLATEAVFTLTQRNSRPLLTHERNLLLIDLAPQFGGRRTEIKALLEAYEAAWARLQTETPGGPSDLLDGQFHTAVLTWLRYHRAMLIGELVPLMLAYIQQNPHAEALPDYGHVLVDEYQDLNRADQELTGRLADGGTLMVIGDDSQSIYGFRYANPEGIRTFEASNPGTTSFNLEICRRCPPNIVAMSNFLIAHDAGRARAIPLVPDLTLQDADIHVVQADTVEEEAETVADYVHAYLDAHAPLPGGQVLILTPRRFLGNRIRDLLVDRGRNATSYFAEDPLKPPRAALGICLLMLLVNPEDRVALRYWLGADSATGLRGTYAKLRSYADEQQLEPSEVLRRLAAGEELIGGLQRLVDRWQHLEEALGLVEDLVGLDLVRALWPPDEDECDEVRLIGEEIAVRDPDPEHILQELVTRITQPELPDSSDDVVRIMSLHKSKGLTATLVVVAGCMAGALPRISTGAPQPQQDAEMDEQRRLFYVAITRPRRSLVVSSSRHLPLADAMQNGIQVTRVRYDRGTPEAVTATSPFVAEMGAAVPEIMTAAEWRETRFPAAPDA